MLWNFQFAKITQYKAVDKFQDFLLDFSGPGGAYQIMCKAYLPVYHVCCVHKKTGDNLGEVENESGLGTK